MNPYQQGHQYCHNIGFSNAAPQSFANPNPMPGFPTSGYPPSQFGQSQFGQPQVNAQYPSAGGYQSQGYPHSNPGSGNPVYPSAGPGYPSAGPGYPAPDPHNPFVTPGYPQSNPGSGSQGFPSAGPGYPCPAPRNPSTPGYPTTSPGYPTGSQPCYPQQGNVHGQSQGYQSSSANQTHHSPYPSGPQMHAATSQWSPPKGKPTVVPANPFDPRKDAETLRKAMKGFGTDEKTIIQCLTRRSNEQRIRIAFEFKTLYGKDLIADLKSETSGKFEDLLVALMTPLPQFYAKELHGAMHGIGTDEDVLIEVMCTMSNHEIQVIKQAYTAMYGSLLEDDLRGDTSGNFKRLMTSLCVGNRSEDFRVDQAQAQADARSLLQAGEMRLGTDESVFNAVLCSRSYPQLAAIFHEYHNITGHDIDDAIKNEFSGDVRDALRAIVKVVRNKPLFFAEHLHKSMKGLGTNDRQLIRIMVTRSEVDLGDIADMFQSKYGESLASWIEGDCSGHYKKCLLGLLGLY